jgi:hypothetical protein
MGFSKSGFGMPAPKIFFFSRHLPCSLYRVGRESDAGFAGLSDFEKALDLREYPQVQMQFRTFIKESAKMG